MRKRFKTGNVRRIQGSWNGRYYDENGKRRSVTLGRISEMPKSAALRMLSEILRDINGSTQQAGPGVLISVVSPWASSLNTGPSSHRMEVL